MDLIIKPTMACQFKCTFCSSNNISKKHTLFDLNMLRPYLEKYNIGTVIINGGDPLMVPPSYYFELDKLLDEYGHTDVYVCLTTNLWDYYEHPDKWRPLFKKRRFRIMNSFQYGNQRLKPDCTPYTEEDMIKIMNMYEKDRDERFSFLTVITEENEDTVIKTVELAKRLGTICRINPAVQSGRSKQYYPHWKMMQHYINIYKAGLMDFEFNTKQVITNILNGKSSVCPWNRDCLHGIRAFNPEGLVHPCGSFGDNHYVSDKTYELSEYDEQEIAKDYPYIKSECITCDNFLLCNSCYKNIHDIKVNGDEEEHCSHMKQIISSFKEEAQCQHSKI